jgi:hypothetical protein
VVYLDATISPSAGCGCFSRNSTIPIQKVDMQYSRSAGAVVPINRAIVWGRIEASKYKIPAKEYSQPGTFENAFVCKMAQPRP